MIEIYQFQNENNYSSLAFLCNLTKTKHNFHFALTYNFFFSIFFLSIRFPFNGKRWEKNLYNLFMNSRIRIMCYWVIDFIHFHLNYVSFSAVDRHFSLIRKKKWKLFMYGLFVGWINFIYSALYAMVKVTTLNWLNIEKKKRRWSRSSSK